MYHKSLNLFHSSVYRERARLESVEHNARARNAELMTQINELRTVNQSYKSEIAALKIAVDDLKLRALLHSKRTATPLPGSGIHYQQKLSATLRTTNELEGMIQRIALDSHPTKLKRDSAAAIAHGVAASAAAARNGTGERD